MPFADDTSLFTVVQDTIAAAADMNHDLELIRHWAHGWRRSINPDRKKQAVELILSKKRIEAEHPEIRFNNIPVIRFDDHKHLGFILDSKFLLLLISYVLFLNKIGYWLAEISLQVFAHANTK